MFDERSGSLSVATCLNGGYYIINGMGLTPSHIGNKGDIQADMIDNLGNLLECGEYSDFKFIINWNFVIIFVEFDF